MGTKGIYVLPIPQLQCRDIRKVCKAMGLLQNSENILGAETGGQQGAEAKPGQHSNFQSSVGGVTETLSQNYKQKRNKTKKHAVSQVGSGLAYGTRSPSKAESR